MRKSEESNFWKKIKATCRGAKYCERIEVKQPSGVPDIIYTTPELTTGFIELKYVPLENFNEETQVLRVPKLTAVQVAFLKRHLFSNNYVFVSVGHVFYVLLSFTGEWEAVREKEGLHIQHNMMSRSLPDIFPLKAYT